MHVFVTAWKGETSKIVTSLDHQISQLWMSQWPGQGSVPGRRFPQNTTDATTHSHPAHTANLTVDCVSFARPFGDDGLPGSSRPMPDPEESLVVGPRTYTWHQQLRLSAVFGEHEVAPPWSPVPFQGVWVNVDGEPAQGVLPDYAKCFQW